MDQTLVFDPEIIRRYDCSGPRYTSYPTAVQFHEGFRADRYCEVARASNETTRPLSLYFHLPFCDTVCFYCACNKVVTKDRTRSGPYLERLHREIRLQGALFDRSRVVTQLHWGGGTPTFLSHGEMQALMEETRHHFTLLEDGSGEYAIEIDPREAQVDTIALLRSLGFTRISLGVQDFDTRVQQAVNRIQTEKETTIVLEAARSQGFGSISVDLIYGLPFQSVKSFGTTLEKILAVRPDRISLFNYAHLPDLFPPQRRIRAEDLPSPAEKLAILHSSIDHLTAAGYLYIGMDHFAMPGDELARAQREGTLHRNFQGYSTQANVDLIGLGSTAISQVGSTYSQNARDLEHYYTRLGENELPLFRGIELNEDDRIRREVITQLICHFRLDYAAVAREYGIQCADYFSQEISELAILENDGLIALSPIGIQVQPRGKLLIRNICMVFDRYLRSQTQRRFSKVI